MVHKINRNLRGISMRVDVARVLQLFLWLKIRIALTARVNNLITKGYLHLI